jgi:SAM-dependent methyltransferase
MNQDTAKQPAAGSSHYRCDHCLMCHSKDIELVMPMAKTAIGNDYFPNLQQQETFSLSLYLCRQCGNVQIEDVVNPELLFRSYTYSTKSSLGLVEHFRQYSEAVAKRSGASAGSLVIDIGSNDGSLLKAFKGLGYKVLGVDPAVDIARRATAEGVETIPDFFTADKAREILKRFGQAAIMTANNVFAHSDKLPDMADGIRTLLRPDGIFTFEVSYLLDIVQKMLFDTVYHEHLCYHSIRSLQSFFMRHELELIDVDRIASKGGSLRGIVQPAGGPRPTSPVIGQMIEWEGLTRLHESETFAAYAKKIDEAKDSFIDLIDRIKADGKTVAGYGASPTVTTLLYQFDLGKRLDFLVDDNPVKQNTFSPGQHIRVYPSEALQSRNADAVAILAWYYAQPIMAKHKAFADRGGRFIVPLPLLQVA